jgi:hypothetical protein
MISAIKKLLTNRNPLSGLVLIDNEMLASHVVSPPCFISYKFAQYSEYATFHHRLSCLPYVKMRDVRGQDLNDFQVYTDGSDSITIHSKKQIAYSIELYATDLTCFDVVFPTRLSPLFAPRLSQSFGSSR